MKVVTLISVPNDVAFNNCTLVLSSLRTGFPTADVEVYINSPDYYAAIREKITDDSIEVTALAEPMHHAKWIERMINENNGELIILDGDVILWKEWTYKFDTLLAGMFVPFMYNEFAQCISYPRLHTSFLCIKNCKELRATVAKCYKMATVSPEYAPLNPYMPDVKFVSGAPSFWDSCSVLYNIVGGTPFVEEHLECYDHLNSASFLDIMANNMEKGFGFRQAHETISKYPQMLKGTWRHIINYYAEMQAKATTILNK